MTIVASIDVGIKNLAMCIMENAPGDAKNFHRYSILLWDVFNLLENDTHLCKGLTKKGTVCGRKSTMKWTVQGAVVNYSCKTHFPKHITTTAANKYAQKKVNDYLLQDIALAVITKLNHLFETYADLFKTLDKVVIELQPKVNNKMKFISHIIYGKFVEFLTTSSQQTIKKCTVRFVRAAQKLKAYTGPALECALKGAYAKRKWLSIQYTSWFLTNKFNVDQKNAWYECLQTHSKADDLCDTFLMSINELHGITPAFKQRVVLKAKKSTKRKVARKSNK